MLAAARGHAEVCGLLIKEGARVDLRRFRDNRTHVRKSLTMLTRHSVCLLLHNGLGFRTLIINLEPLASSFGTCVGTCRKCRTCLVISLRRQWTALHIAAWKGHLKTVQARLSPMPHGSRCFPRNGLLSSPHVYQGVPAASRTCQGGVLAHFGQNPVF